MNAAPVVFSSGDIFLPSILFCVAARLGRATRHAARRQLHSSVASIGARRRCFQQWQCLRYGGEELDERWKTVLQAAHFEAIGGMVSLMADKTMSEPCPEFGTGCGARREIL